MTPRQGRCGVVVTNGTLVALWYAADNALQARCAAMDGTGSAAEQWAHAVAAGYALYREYNAEDPEWVEVVKAGKDTPPTVAAIVAAARRTGGVVADVVGDYAKRGRIGYAHVTATEARVITGKAREAADVDEAWMRKVAAMRATAGMGVMGVRV